MDVGTHTYIFGRWYAKETWQAVAVPSGPYSLTNITYGRRARRQRRPIIDFIANHLARLADIFLLFREGPREQ